MFFDCLDKIKRGLCVCVFDGTDRLQHTFWRDTEPSSEQGARSNEPSSELKTHSSKLIAQSSKPNRVLEELYLRMDALVGRTMAACNDGQSVLMIISDHGFNAFRRGVDLNRWLEADGYLKVRQERRGERHLGRGRLAANTGLRCRPGGDIPESPRTAVAGHGRPGAEAAALCREIAAKLSTLVDPDNGQPAVKQVYLSAETYHGPYSGAAPDLIVGYQRGLPRGLGDGHRPESLRKCSTRTTRRGAAITASIRAWFPASSSATGKVEADQPRLMDIGPTVLEMFGVPLPFLHGRSSIGLAVPQQDVGRNSAAVPAESQRSPARCKLFRPTCSLRGPNGQER